MIDPNPTKIMLETDYDSWDEKWTHRRRGTSDYDYKMWSLYWATTLPPTTKQFDIWYNMERSSSTHIPKNWAVICSGGEQNEN